MIYVTLFRVCQHFYCMESRGRGSKLKHKYNFTSLAALLNRLLWSRKFHTHSFNALGWLLQKGIFNSLLSHSFSELTQMQLFKESVRLELPNVCALSRSNMGSRPPHRLTPLYPAFEAQLSLSYLVCFFCCFVFLLAPWHTLSLLG